MDGDGEYVARMEMELGLVKASTTQCTCVLPYDMRIGCGRIIRRIVPELEP